MNLPVHQLTELTPKFVAAINSGKSLNEIQSHKNWYVDQGLVNFFYKVPNGTLIITFYENYYN